MSTWMVVEDEPDLYDTLLFMLEMWSIDGVAFTNGTDTLKWIDEVDRGTVEANIPELALLDIRLPDSSGHEIGYRLRCSPTLKDITIVLMTAYKLSPKEEKMIKARAQADLLIYKPLPEPAEFRETLLDLIVQRRARSKTPPRAN